MAVPLDFYNYLCFAPQGVWCLLSDTLCIPLLTCSQFVRDERCVYGYKEMDEIPVDLNVIKA